MVKRKSSISYKPADEPVIIDIDKLIMIESGGDPNAVSPKGAIGLTQIMPDTLKQWNKMHKYEQYTINDLYNPKINRKIGNWYINKEIPRQLKSKGVAINETNVLRAYNAGPGTVSKVEKNPGTEAYTKEAYMYPRKYRQANKGEPLTIEPTDEKTRVAPREIKPDKQKKGMLDMENEQMGMTLAQEEMSNGGQTEEDQSTIDDSEYWDKYAEVSKPEAKKIVNSMVAKGTQLLHSPQTRDKILKSLASNPNPIDGVAKITSRVVERLDRVAEKQGTNLPDSLRVGIAANILDQVAEIGEASGVAKLTPDQKEAAFSTAVQEYLNGEIGRGRIDKEQLAENNGAYVRSLSPDRRIELDRQLMKINDVATSTSDESYRKATSIASPQLGMLDMNEEEV